MAILQTIQELPRRVALITGCGKQTGIGAATARLFASQGVSVVVSDIAPRGLNNEGQADEASGAASWTGLDSLVQEIRAGGGTATSAVGSVTSEEDVARIVQQVIDEHGRLDILVNNAGAPHGPDRVDIAEISFGAYENVMAINTRGPFLMSRAAIPHMRRNAWGRIVNIASEVAVHGGYNRAAYGASKAALFGLAKCMALDVAPWGITVNTVCPGWTATSRMTSYVKRLGIEDVEAELERLAEKIPARRMGTPDDIAHAIAYFTSEGAGYVTAQNLLVDGGGLNAAR